ncbi:hypothetical protein W97_04741 [Coniosporium apollinis CBS 100218]|uniref:Vesicular-fusion protein SEC18 n=1 Tax=Coniosporium apollinis (strain CBS 100218) TaxID=1168221 RepID=R7YUH7_CONA1|nr:uncharacterized protein W97_04741 [Coniosporium apollinis CBS 100218]EON65503.1 hypothetical protein W97_04741 [Coniosporium apollinis CBS 100218]
MPNPFGGRSDGSPRPPARDGYARPGQQDTRMGGGYPEPPAYRDSPPRMPAQPQYPSGGDGRSLQLRPVRSPGGNQFAMANWAAVSPQNFRPSRDGSDIYVMINNNFVLTARPHDGCPQGEIGLTDAQRTWIGVTIGPQEIVQVQPYDPFRAGEQTLGSIDAEVGFATNKKTTDVPYDQDELAKQFTRNFENQVLAPGQVLLMDFKNVPLRCTIRTIKRVDLSMEKAEASSAPTTSDPRARGILIPQTTVDWFKDNRTDIKLKASNRRPAANSIIQPDFKFQDMGIGGLDNEFSAIFRRAFASRIFPPGLVDKLGIQHVRGILLYGPPGTGKTLIARQIGKMLNAREPKIINGPEVLNKYVGQSEENVRKLFADAEKEYKEKGDESGLHIIIFDELDAVCKQRGSGAGGGTGVGDSVVNQLLSKLDGVDQLNNILLIGMTNRMDMIDEALLRPGRLEVKVEISLPDEHGRQQILSIHTNKMRTSGVMDRDVDLAELARLTKNFSGAEISGLVKAASSFAFSRHVKVGTMAGIKDDVENLKVNRQDFFNALDEVKPLFGVAEEELSSRIRGGIIHYSPLIDNILAEGRLCVTKIKQPVSENSNPLHSAILFGPRGSGKTALAAKIAIDSEFPFVKLLTAEDMVGFADMQKVAHIDKTFRDAYKSPLSIVVIDSIELIVDWNPIGPRFSNPVLAALKVLIHKQPPKNRRLLILATTSKRTELQQLDIFEDFDDEIAVPNVNTQQELAHVLQASGAFSEQDQQRTMYEIARYMEDNRRTDVGVGIKKVLDSIEIARKDPDVAGRFAQRIIQAMIASGLA